MHRAGITAVDVAPCGGTHGHRGSHFIKPALPRIARRNFDQRAHSRHRVGLRRQGHTRSAEVFHRTLHHFVFGIDHHKLAIRRHRRRLAEAQCEIRLLAEQHHQIGVCQHAGKSAPRGIVDAARAFHAQRRHAGCIGKLFHQRRNRRMRHHGAQQNQRTRGRGDQRGQCSCRLAFQCVFHRRELRGSGQRTFAVGHFGFEYVKGQAQMHRTGPAGPRDATGLGDVSAERFSARCRPRSLDQRRSNIRLAHFLEGAAPQFIEGRMARQQDQRGLRSQCGIQRTDAVGMSRTAGEHDDARLAGQARPGIRHVYGSAFITDMGNGQLRFDGRVVHRHDVIAGQREHPR